MDPVDQVPLQISPAEAAHGGQQWLRMLAQAGATMLPAPQAVPSRSVAESPSEAERTADLWAAIIIAPEASPTAAPGLADLAPSHTRIPSLQAATEARATTPPTPTVSAAERFAGQPAAMEPAGETGSTAASRTPPTGDVPRPKKAGTGAAPYSSANHPATGPASPNLKSFIPQSEKPALTSYPNLSDADRVVQLKLLETQVKVCTKCPDLVKFRTQAVFGTGNVRPRLVMMGEAPGADEDRQGEPFVGASGQLLDKIIAAMKLRRQDVYILNTVKCRPPQNRNPSDVECLNCRPYWEEQLELLQPEVIVCLGAVASKTLLQTTKPVGQLRGEIHEYRGAQVVVTYHPSYLLRTESAKRQTWDDMKVVMNILGLPL